MPILAGTVVHAARDYSPLFDKQQTPDVVALRFLAQFQQRTLVDIARLKPDALHTPQVITLPLADFDAGEAVAAHLRVHGGKATFTDAQRRPEDLNLVEYPLRLDRPQWPAAYIRARTLFLLGSAEDWVDVDEVTLDLFPAGPDSLTPATELVLPGSALHACATAVAVFMAGRIEGGTTIGADAGDAYETYLDEVTDRRIAKVSTIREVW